MAENDTEQQFEVVHETNLDDIAMAGGYAGGVTPTRVYRERSTGRIFVSGGGMDAEIDSKTGREIIIGTY